MIPALNTSSARRVAAVGLAALLFAGCTVVPTVTPTPSPTLLPTVPPTTPPYTLGPTESPSPYGCPTSAPAALSGTATVTMTTNFGNIVIKVDSTLGANAAGAFVALASCGYYNNVLFHRVVPGFVIQGGDGQYGRLPNDDPSKMGTGGPGWTIPDDKVTTPYKRGTVAMARTANANSGNSQFFIVLADSAESTLGASAANNYAIFGNVTSGLDVVDRIALVPLGGEPGSDGSAPSMPLEPVVITSTVVTTP
ncbi:MAG: peptidylprolyl isomerase [Candidatus Limnocylindrales bacterium]